MDRGASALLVLCLVALLAVPAAGAADAPGPIRLRSGTIFGPDDDAGLALAMRLSPADLDGGGAVLVKLAGPLTPETRASLEEAGVTLAAPLGERAFIAWLAAGGLDRAAALEGVAWTAPYHPGLRVDPDLTSLAPDVSVRVPLSVLLFARAEVAEVASRLERLGLEVSGTSAGREASRADGRPRAYRPGRIVVTVSPDAGPGVVDEVARWPEVLWIGRRPVYGLLNDASAWVGQSGLDGGQQTPVYDHGLFGEGETIGILDTGLDADMCFFREADGTLPPVQEGFGTGSPDPSRRKVTIVNFLWSGDDPANAFAWDSQDHGTHVAGSAAGDNLATPGVRDTADGMAPAARLVIQDAGYGIDDCADLPAIGCPAADLYPFFEQARDQGARIHSNSWGDRENFTPYNIYSDGSEAADTFMWDYPDMLLVFAAGNNGPSNATVASPATGKNVLAVGATGHGSSAGAIASFSSRGPTHDNRVKPDVTIPGSSVISADNDGSVVSNNCGTKSSSGTSMAAPTAAGLAALVAEFYRKGYYPSGSASPADAMAPSAALLKATLIASARPMESVTEPPPGYAQGWGRILLDDALFFPGDALRTFAADVPSRFDSPDDPTDTYTLHVFDGGLPLRVVLAWTDYPSTPAAAVNLVNDLDLEVESPSGAVYLGNVFSSGVSATGGTADHVNNVEAARIENPETGTWTVRVIPSAIPEPGQGYALVATGRLPVPGVFLERASLDVDDSVGGNADGVLEPGEWADLPLALLNSGDSLASMVGVSAESLTAGAEIHAASTTLPDIPAGESRASLAPALRIRLAADFPCTAPLTLRLTYTAAGFLRVEDVQIATGTEATILHEDFEGASGWAHQAAESTATSGNWIVGDPNATTYQPGDDASPDPGTRCLFTQYNLNGDGDGDVDDGVVVARSPSYDLSGHPGARLRIARWFAHRDVGMDAGDWFRLEIRENPLAADVLLEQLGSNVSVPAWKVDEFRVADFVTPGAQVELKVSAADGPAAGNLLEAAIDEILFFEPQCEIWNPAPAEVTTLRGTRSGADVELAWDRPAPDPAHGEADRYRVYASVTPDGGWTLEDEVPDTSEASAWTDLGGVSGPALVFYRVIAGNDAGYAEPLP